MKDGTINTVVDGLLDSCGAKHNNNKKKSKKRRKEEAYDSELVPNPFELYEPDEDDSPRDRKSLELA